MQDSPIPKNAVAAIRVSTTRQGTEGDSPEAQREQIERFAAARNMKVKKLFLFLESASKEQQPMQEAIDYCTNPAHRIELFIIKSIDRFTRGGSYSYSNLKMQLERSNVRLIDIYGIIGANKVNTLEHLGVSYSWSVYDPTKNSEILEAERASDEKRDIMSRMIGAEIRYVCLGYWIRRAPFGFINIKAETMHGRRSVLEPHLTESVWVLKMFELRCRGNIIDEEIVKQINRLGYRSRVSLLRSKRDRARIIGNRGSKKLTVKRLQSFVRSPIYAGVASEKWLMGNPVHCRFDGLVSIEAFNKANRGQATIIEGRDSITIERIKTPRMGRKRVVHPDYPYKRVVGCSTCRRPLCGSASRGKNGKYYPAYHCTNYGHHFRTPQKQMHAAVEGFTQAVHIVPRYRKALSEAVIVEWNRRRAILHRDTALERQQMKELKSQACLIGERIKFCSPIAIKYLERDLRIIENEIKSRKEIKEKYKNGAIDLQSIETYASYFGEHPEVLLLDQPDTEQKANYFGLLFDDMPSYEEIHQAINGSKTCPCLSPIFELDNAMMTDRELNKKNQRQLVVSQ